MNLIFRKTLAIFILSLGLLNASYAQRVVTAVVDSDSSFQIIRGFGASNVIRWRIFLLHKIWKLH